jgi:hypothetical protein
MCFLIPAVHFIGRCLPKGDVFLNSKEDSQAAEPYLVVAGRGEQQQLSTIRSTPLVACSSLRLLDQFGKADRLGT